MSKKTQHIAAFTILEVTVVVAIMGILIGIIANTLNRFNEQLKFSSDIHQELNEWFAFRANLWNELYQSDSIHFEENQLNIFDKGIPTLYKLDDESLLRKKEADWIDTKMKASNIAFIEEKGDQIVHIDFSWKGDVMPLEYYYRPEIRNQINAYFDELK